MPAIAVCQPTFVLGLAPPSRASPAPTGICVESSDLDQRTQFPLQFPLIPQIEFDQPSQARYGIQADVSADETQLAVIVVR